MRTGLQEDERLVRFTKICLGFPRAEREIMGSHAGFKVKKKTFAYFLNDHHGDGIVGVTCKVLPGDNAALIKADLVDKGGTRVPGHQLQGKRAPGDAELQLDGSQGRTVQRLQGKIAGGRFGH